jgi:hypothetical protein
LVVEEDGEWAGGVTTWFREALLSNGKKIRVSSPGDGYVLPDFMDRGVFSTSMRAVVETTLKEGGVLSLAFVAVYGHSASVLSKYGFMSVLYPVSKVYILKAERFLDDFLARTRRVILDKRFDNLLVKLVVPTAKGSKECITRVIRIEKGKLKEFKPKPGDRIKPDLTINSDIELLISTASLFYRRKRSLYFVLLASLLRRRLGLRFSLKLLRIYLGI